jgi:predicted transcriptional regulator
MNAVVKDVMSTHPVWVSKTSSFKEIAAGQFRVSAFPVLDADGTVIGVVSEADMLRKEALDDRGGVRGTITGLLHCTEQAKAEGVTAADLMTSPGVTVTADDAVEHAARLMYSARSSACPWSTRAADWSGSSAGPTSWPSLAEPMRRSARRS